MSEITKKKEEIQTLLCVCLNKKSVVCSLFIVHFFLFSGVQNSFTWLFFTPESCLSTLSQVPHKQEVKPFGFIR